MCFCIYPFSRQANVLLHSNFILTFALVYPPIYLGRTGGREKMIHWSEVLSLLFVLLS